MPGRGSGDITAAQQAHLRMLDAVVTVLSHAGLSLQPALPGRIMRALPGDRVLVKERRAGVKAIAKR